MLLQEARTIKAQYKQYTLKYKIQQSTNSCTFSTDDPDVICIVRSINNLQQRQSYQKQKNLLLQVRHTNIIGMVDYYENGKMAYLFLENCFNDLKKYYESTQDDIQEGLILKIIHDVLKGLEALHLNGTAHRNISLDSIIQSSDGIFKLSQLNNTSQTEIVSQTNKTQIIKSLQLLNSSELYRSPQQLHPKVGDEIGTKVDIFALGIVIYLLCYKNFPFQSKSSVSFKKYMIPQNSKYSKVITSIIDECLKTNIKQRPSAEQLLSKFVIKTRTRVFSICQDNKVQSNTIQLDQKLILLKNWINSSPRKYSQGVNFNILSSIKKIYNNLTTQTQSWIINYIQNNDSIASSKYDKAIITKCWEKRYKVSKVYEILERQVIESPSKVFTNLKILILLHNFLRKGPLQAIITQMYPTPTSICQKINLNQLQNQKQSKSFLSLIIQTYSLLLKQKIRIGFKYSMFILGNYCLLPFFNIPTEQKILSFTFFITLRNFLERLVKFHQCLLRQNISKQIQRAIVLSIVDQQYCLVSLLVHLYSTFKHSTNYIEQNIDKSTIIFKITEFQKKFQVIFLKFVELLERTNKFSSLFENGKLTLSMNIMKILINIPILGAKKNFNIKNYLNYENDICGLKIPKPYSQVLQVPRQLYYPNDSLKKQGCQNYVQIQSFTKKASTVPNKFLFDTATTQHKKKKDNSNNLQDFDFSKQSVVKKQRQSIIQFTHQNLNSDLQKTSKIKHTQPIKQFLSLGYSSHLSNSIFIPDNNNNQFSDLLELQSIQTKNAFVKQGKPQRKQSTNINSPVKQPKQQSNHNIISQQIITPQNNTITLSNFITQEVTKNANQYLIRVQQLKFMEQIGRGHSSEVFKGEWRGQTVAIKKIKLSNDNLTQQFKRQLATTIKLRPHQNLVTLIGVSEENNYFNIVNQYCSGGNLFNLLHKSKVTLTWQVKVQIAKQIAQGMIFLHSNLPPIIHRDLKSLNILLVDPYVKQSDKIKLKIGDFGLSKQISDCFMTGVLGTYHWMAPQIFNNQHYSIKADVFSYGIVLWQILARRTPYQNLQSVQSLIKYVGIENGRPDLSMISTKCPVELKLLMMRCWSTQPKDRPSFDQILTDLNKISYF